MPNLTHFTSGNRYSACILLLFLIVLCLLPACRDHSTGLDQVQLTQLKTLLSKDIILQVIFLNSLKKLNYYYKVLEL